MNKFGAAVFGVTPNIFETSGDQFIDKYFASKESGLNLIE